MKIRTFIIVILLIRVLTACTEKEESTSQVITVQNLTSFNIDKIILYSYGPLNTIEFIDIAAGEAAGPNILVDMSITTKFEIISGGSSLEIDWTMPSHIADPPGGIFALYPDGSYTFSLVESDTFKDGVAIVLSSFRFY